MKNKLIDIKIKRSTLPKDGQKIKWQTYDDVNNNTWKNGEFCSGDDLFVVNMATWDSCWKVFHWKKINK